MRAAKMWPICAVLAALVIAAAAAQETAPVPGPAAPVAVEVAVREEPEQMVLYKIHKGPYEKMGETIQPMFMTAFGQGLNPQMTVGMAYLNNPSLIEPDHFLTEVRLKVGEAALAKSGTLADGMDVKKVKAHQVAVLMKPKGMGDQEALRRQLLTWSFENGYAVTGNCVEWMKAETPGAGYEQMESEILFPVIKVTE